MENLKEDNREIFYNMENKNKENRKINKEDFLKKMNEIKEKMMQLNNSTIKKLNDYSDNMNQHFNYFKNTIKEKYEKDNKLLESNIKNNEELNKKYKLNLEKLENTLNINDNIQDIINKEIKAFQNILTEDFFFKKNLFQEYVIRNQEILLDSNIYSNMYLKLNKKDKVKLYKSLKNQKIVNYIERNFQLNSLHLNGKNNKNENKELLIKNKNFSKITLKNYLKDDLNSLFKNEKYIVNKDLNQDNSSLSLSRIQSNLSMNYNEYYTFINVNKITLINCENFENNFDIYFPNLNKLYLRKINCSNFNFNNLTNISVLNLDDCNIGDYVFSKISKFSFNNLKIISLKNNKISKVNELKFSNLEEFDLENNVVSSFPAKSIITTLLNLKIINLTRNNYTYNNKDTDIEYLCKKFQKNKIFLLFGNVVLNIKILKEQYLEYFIQNIKTLNYPLRRLNFQFFFDKNNFSQLKEIDLISFQSSLISLNLSSCYLSNEQINELLLNNMKLINLKELNLSINEIKQQFFNDFIKFEFNLIFPKLKTLDLSLNPINFEKKEEFEKFEEFIIKTPSLYEINFIHVSFEKLFNNYLKKQLNSILKDNNNIDKNIPYEIPLSFTDEEFKDILTNSSIIIPTIYLKSLTNKEYIIKFKKYSKNLFLKFKKEEETS